MKLRWGRGSGGGGRSKGRGGKAARCLRPEPLPRCMMGRQGEATWFSVCVCVCLTLCQWVEPRCQAPGGGEVVVGVQRSDSGPLVL